MPVWAGFANYIVPLQIGARDMAFPRLNALSYWLYLAGGIVFYAVVFFSPSRGRLDLLHAAVHRPVHPRQRHGRLDLPDPPHRPELDPRRAEHHRDDRKHARARHGLGRMPLFCWSLLAQAIMIVLDAAGDRGRGHDDADRPALRHLLLRPECGGSALLYQHLFWFFGHPEVYIMILPAFGVISEVLPVFARKPIFGYKAIAASSIGIAFLSMLVWAHHMFATPMATVVLVFFMISSMAIADPHRGEGPQLGRDAVPRLDRARDPAVLRLRLPRPVHAGRHHRRDAGGLPDRPPGHRHLLRRRPLPLRARRRRGLRGDGRALLLVSEDDRPDAVGARSASSRSGCSSSASSARSSSSTRSGSRACRGASTPTARHRMGDWRT